MANYSLISIGIDRYQSIQPLNYAQADAQAIWKFTLEEAQLPPEEALLFADASPWVDEQPTTPSKDNILQGLQRPVGDRIPPWLWFFFSGYGVSWEGIDYLLPLEGNLSDIPNTGIPTSLVFEALRRRSQSNILALLDINRSPGLIAANPVGAQTLDLAREMGINTILSSQVQQMSHESSDLEHGFFTATLLEALRYYSTDVTLDKLEEYLRDRLPELCEHHWRPPQRPAIVIPFPEVRQQLILPRAGASVTEEVYATISPALLETNTPELQSNGKAVTAQIATSAPISRQNPPLLSSNSNIPPNSGQGGNLLDQIEQSPGNGPAEGPDFQKWLAVGGGLFLLFLLAGLFLNNRPQPQLSDATRPEELGSPDGEGVPEGTAPPPGETTPQPAVSPSVPVPVASPPANPSVPAPVASPPAPSPAVPKTPTPPATTTPVPSFSTQPPNARLVVASTHIQTVQASKFSRAIADARKVPPESPDYQEAQRCITTWSLSILDIARGRANRGDFSGAIAAASLVMPDRQETYQLAQQKIQTWRQLAQKQQKNQAIIAAAKKTVRPEQASSYNQAISKLRTIPIGEPGYLEAKKLKEYWSQRIYLIANSRAAKGQFKPAIETAQLVPADTPARASAQNAIARWQKGQR